MKNNYYDIILADDHKILRAGLKSLIEDDPELRVVGEAQDGEDLLEQLEDHSCDLIVLDICMPRMEGISALKILHKKFPQIRVLVLTMQKDAEHLKCAMGYGASGYVLKDDAFDQLVAAIRTIRKGKTFVSPSISETVARRFIRPVEEDAALPSLEILTRREQQILKSIASGMANKNIATKFKISIRTVETHRANLTNKLGIKSMAGLVKYAMAKGLV